MHVYSWNSYSCNNSSSYRLVGRFKTAKAAEAMAEELEEFFEAFGTEMDQALEDNDYNYPKEPIPTAKALAAKYKLKWKGFLSWGDEGLSYGFPDVVASDETLVIFHDYCGGFGETIPKILKKAGAKVEPESQDHPTVTVTMTLAKGKKGAKAAKALSDWFSQANDHDDIDAWGVTPWGDEIYGEADETAWFSDGKTFEFHMQMMLRAVDDLIEWLEKNSNDYDIKICKYDELERIKKRAASAEMTTDDVDPASLAMEGHTFVFTGKLATMTRAEAKKRAEAGGAKVGSSVTKNLDYLIVGDEGSPLFGEGVKGSKIRAAEKLIAGGAALQILSENTFLRMGKGAKKKVAAKKATKKAAVKKTTKKAAPKKAAPKKTTKKAAPKKAAPKKATKSKGGKLTIGKKFLFTGKLASMTRSEAKARVRQIEGKSAGSVSKDLDYLVIGDEGSPLYGEGKKGSKMVAAEKLQAGGSDVQIISESDFLKMKRK